MKLFKTLTAAAVATTALTGVVMTGTAMANPLCAL